MTTFVTLTIHPYIQHDGWIWSSTLCGFIWWQLTLIIYRGFFWDHPRVTRGKEAENAKNVYAMMVLMMCTMLHSSSSPGELFSRTSRVQLYSSAALRRCTQPPSQSSPRDTSLWWFHGVPSRWICRICSRRCFQHSKQLCDDRDDGRSVSCVQSYLLRIFASSPVRLSASTCSGMFYSDTLFSWMSQTGRPSLLIHQTALVTWSILKWNVFVAFAQIIGKLKWPPSLF